MNTADDFSSPFLATNTSAKKKVKFNAQVFLSKCEVLDQDKLNPITVIRAALRRHKVTSSDKLCYQTYRHSSSPVVLSGTSVSA